MKSSASPFLASLIEESFERQGSYLAHAFSSLDAEESSLHIVEAMEGFRTVAFSVVNSLGNPLNSPVACCFRKDRFYMPCSMASLKVKCIRKNPAASMTYFSESSFALIVHGEADIVESGNDTFEEVDAAMLKQYGSSIRTWEGTGLFLALSPSQVHTHGEIS